MRASSDPFLMVRDTFWIFSLVLRSYKDIYKEVSSHNEEMLPQKSWSKRPVGFKYILSSKTFLEAHAYVPDVYTIPMRQIHLFRWQEYKNHSFALTAKMLMLCPLFTSLVSLSQSNILWESWLSTQNNDNGKQPTISKCGNSQLTAHISVNDPLAEKTKWYQGKTQTRSVAFLQRMQ